MNKLWIKIMMVKEDGSMRCLTRCKNVRIAATHVFYDNEIFLIEPDPIRKKLIIDSKDWGFIERPYPTNRRSVSVAQWEEEYGQAQRDIEHRLDMHRAFYHEQ